MAFCITPPEGSAVGKSERSGDRLPQAARRAVELSNIRGLLRVSKAYPTSFVFTATLPAFSDRVLVMAKP